MYKKRTRQKFDMTYTLKELQQLYHIGYTKIRELYDASNSEKEFIYNIEKYKEKRAIRLKPEGPTEKIINEIHREYPLVAINTLYGYFYKTNHNIEETKRLASKLSKYKISEKRVKEFIKKSGVNYSNFIKHYKSIFGVSNFEIDKVTENDLKIIHEFYIKKRYIKIVQKKIHEYCKLYNILYTSIAKLILDEFFDGHFKNLKCKNDKELDILLSDIDYFVKDTYGTSPNPNRKKINTFKRKGKFSIPGYKNIREYFDDAFKNKNISYSYLTILYNNSDSLEEFLQKIQECIESSERYPKEKFKEVNEKIIELSKKYGIKPSTARVLMFEYGMNKHELVDNPNLFNVLDIILKSRYTK